MKQLVIKSCQLVIKLYIKCHSLILLQKTSKIFILRSLLIINYLCNFFKNFSKISFKNIWLYQKNPVLLHSQFSDKAHRQTQRGTA